MSMIRTVLTALTLLIITVPTSASNLPDSADIILLPLAFLPGVQVHGAKGTVWQGEVWLQNRNNQRAPLEANTCMEGNCQPAAEPNSTGILSSLPEASDRGVVFFVVDFESLLLTFSNRVFEVTRHAQPQGLQLPVVHSRDFIVGETSLLGIPTAGARAAIRIYDPLPLGGEHKMTFRIDAISEAGAVVGTTTMATTFLPYLDGYGRYQPSFAAIYDVGAAIPGVTTLSRYHLQVTPLGPTAADVYWAMVSVTDNDTQQVLIITPQ